MLLQVLVIVLVLLTKDFRLANCLLQAMVIKSLDYLLTRIVKAVFFGALGTFNYSFDNIYLADVSVRFDGNSEFGADQRFAPFFSGGLGLNLHNYKFMKQFEWMDRLKIRGTYGITGKVDFSPYEAQTIYKVVTDNWF